MKHRRPIAVVGFVVIDWFSFRSTYRFSTVRLFVFFPLKLKKTYSNRQHTFSDEKALKSTKKQKFICQSSQTTQSKLLLHLERNDEYNENNNTFLQ